MGKLLHLVTAVYRLLLRLFESMCLMWNLLNVQGASLSIALGHCFLYSFLGLFPPCVPV